MGSHFLSVKNGMSMTKFNPRNEGQCFNQEALPSFNDVTDQQKREAEQRLADLIDHTHKELGFKEEN